MISTFLSNCWKDISQSVPLDQSCHQNITSGASWPQETLIHVSMKLSFTVTFISPHWRHHKGALRWQTGRWRDRAPAAASLTSGPQLCSQPRSNHSHGYWRGTLPDKKEKGGVENACMNTYRSASLEMFFCVFKSGSCVIEVAPCSSVCSTSGTQEDSQVSVKVEKPVRHKISLSWKQLILHCFDCITLEHLTEANF